MSEETKDGKTGEQCDCLACTMAREAMARGTEAVEAEKRDNPGPQTDLLNPALVAIGVLTKAAAGIALQSAVPGAAARLILQVGGELLVRSLTDGPEYREMTRDTDLSTVTPAGRG